MVTLISIKHTSSKTFILFQYNCKNQFAVGSFMVKFLLVKVERYRHWKIQLSHLSLPWQTFPKGFSLSPQRFDSTSILLSNKLSCLNPYGKASYAAFHSRQTEKATTHQVVCALKICISSKRLRSEVPKKALRWQNRYQTIKSVVHK